MNRIFKFYFWFFIFMAFGQATANATDVIIEGYEISTTSSDPGIYVANATLPNEDVFLIQYYFSGDIESSEVKANFNDIELVIIEGDPLVEEQIATLALDISDYKALSGTFKIALIADSNDVQEFMVIDDVSAVPDEQPEVLSSGGGGGSSEVIVVVLIFLIAFRLLAKRSNFRDT